MTTPLLKTLGRACFSRLSRHTEQIRLESTTYKAALVREALKDLSIEPKKRPELDENQVRIQVRYCSVNSADLTSFRDGSKDLPFTPGYELSGEVIEVGKKVTNEQVLKGQKVAALSFEKYGGFGEECVLDIKDVFQVPSNVQLKDAAVLPSAHSLAMFSFSKLTELKKDDQVVITAGTAGLGLAAVDVAANVYGAKVIGVVDSNEKAELLRERGVFQTVQYDAKVHKHVHAATKKKGADVVYDAFGEHMIENIGKCTKSGGKIFLAAAGPYTSIPAPPPNCSLTIVSLQDLRLHNFQLYRNIVCETLDLADQGIISAFISAQFDLKDINKALQYIQEKKATGKVVIKMDD